MKKETNKPKEIPEGLKQSFKKADGTVTTLEKGLSEKDWWISKGRTKKLILTHSAVQKVADTAGVSKDVQYTILTQPDAYNNYQYTIQAKVCKGKECVTELGEANRSNLGNKGRANPANMAQKRAYDRCVFRLLGISGLLSEEELSDEDEEENKMDGLTIEETKAIAPLINKILLSKTKENMNDFNKEMKVKAKDCNPAQLGYLRKLYSKKVAELTKVGF
jgi:hypothetical protein